MGTFSLVDLTKYNTDKSRTYLDAYASEISRFVDQPCRILELGIRQGGSLLLWRDLFPQSHVVGLDVIPIDVPDDTGRVHTYVGYQQDQDVLDRMAREWAPDGFDIIIDDASHIGTYSSDSFRHLFVEHLKPGGVYVLEDWACGYDPDWPDGAAPGGEHLLAPSVASVGRAADPSGAVEQAHRKIRALAPRVSKRLDRFPAVKAGLRQVYQRGERAVLTTELPSHQAGMVGLVKQIVDACAVSDSSTGAPVRPFRSVNVYPYQVFVHKAEAASGA